MENQEQQPPYMLVVINDKQERLIVKNGGTWKIMWNRYMPTSGSYTFYGMKWTYYFLFLITIMDTVRSCIHMFAPDGGAGSIAGMDVTVAGGQNIIAMFA